MRYEVIGLGLGPQTPVLLPACDSDSKRQIRWRPGRRVMSRPQMSESLVGLEDTYLDLGRPSFLGSLLAVR